MPLAARVSLMLVLACLQAPALAEIYRYLDADGNLVLTDKVPRGQAEHVERLPAREVMTVPALRPSGPSPAPVERPVTVPARTGYTIVIQSPAQDADYPRSGEPIPVAVSVTPALGTAHRFELELDGRAAGSLAAIAAGELAPGRHTLVARVLDKGGKVVASSTVTFGIR